MSLASKLSKYYPDAQWSLNGEDYAGLAWIGPGEKPSEQDIDALSWPSTDPVDYPLLPWQFKAMVIFLGVDAEVQAAIGGIPDAMQRAAAMSRYLNASYYRYDDALLQSMRVAIGMSNETLAEAWMQAKDLTSGA